MAHIDYYEKNKDTINKNKLLNRVNRGHKINLKTVEKYTWSANQKTFLLQNVRIQKVITRKITKEDIIIIINNDENIKDSSKIAWIKTLKTFIDIFEETVFSDIFKKNDDLSIVKNIKDKYGNLNSSLRHLHLILKIYNLSDVFKKNLSKTRYDYLTNIAFDLNQKIQSEKTKEKEKDRRDYVSSFLNMFENELYLRKMEYASNNHIVSVMYTIGCYTKQNLESDSLVYVPRVDELENVELVTDDKDTLNPRRNYYNYLSGRLKINNLKTTNERNDIFKYDHIINPLAREIIKTNIDNRLESKRLYLFPFKKQQIESKLKEHVLFNRYLRKTYQNVYEKLNLRSLDSMSRVMAHSVETANLSYLNSKVYTDAEKKQLILKMDLQLMRNGTV